MAIAKISRAVTGITLAVALSACTTQFRNHGYAPSDAELQEIIVGVDTRATVEDVIGRPSTSGVLTGSAYYYLSDRRSSFAFFEPEVVDRQLVAVSFDGDGVVRNIERFTLRDGRVVPLSRRVTDSSVENSTFLRQLLGNIGNFNPGQFLGGDG
ncbi:MAG: outer membrane protein assembly factor BamE [Rhodobacteraceae bacterium]|nr:outer membrane protein assembly factor BamE [Paracoccaceae bacterium]